MVQDNTLKFMIAGIIAYILYRDFFSKNREGYSRRFGALEGSNNMVLTDDKGNLSSIQFPSGIIVAWKGAIAPEGWALCDGSNGTPDLRGKFILGMNSNSNKNNLSVRELKDEGGKETTTVTISKPEQLPSHKHFYNSGFGGCGCKSDSGIGNDRRETEPTGNSEPITGIPIMPPFYTLAYIMKL